MTAIHLVSISCDDCGRVSRPSMTEASARAAAFDARWMRVGRIDACPDCAPAYRMALKQRAAEDAQQAGSGPG